jgi:hypothetical protein
VCCADYVRCTRGWTLLPKRVRRSHLSAPNRGHRPSASPIPSRCPHRIFEIGEVLRLISDFMLTANLVASARCCQTFEEPSALDFRLISIRVGPIWGCLLVWLFLCKLLRSPSLRLPPNGRDSSAPPQHQRCTDPMYTRSVVTQLCTFGLTRLVIFLALSKEPPPD